MLAGTGSWCCRVVPLLVLLAACAPTSQPASSPRQGGSSPAPGSAPSGQKKVLTLGLQTVLDGFAISASGTLQGGGIGYIEIHSQGMFTSDKTTGHPIPRLVAQQPTLDNGGLRVTDDGKMVATYALRKDVTWEDGAPFTSADLMFTFDLSQDKSMPIPDPTAVDLMESATAPDDSTFAITWKQPYYLADAMGPLLFWPLPSHLLESDYQTMVGEQKDVRAFMNKPYWTTDYVHIGPFKLVDFNQGVDATFDAVENYFLGMPKVDRIVVKEIPDPNTLYANIVSGAIDISTDNALPIEQGVELKARWDADKGGTVWYSTGPTWFISYQFDQSTPDFNRLMLDPVIRQALYQAIDRDAYSEAVQGGITGKAAYALLSPDHPLYSFVKDGWKDRYPYDPQKATALFESDGWKRGPDGMLVNASGAHLPVESRTTQGNDKKQAVIADMWRKVGVDATEEIIGGPRVRDRVYRQAFPAIEVTARGNEDVVLTRVECAAMPSAANSYSGNNRGHWCNPDVDRLTARYRAELNEQARGPLIQQLQELILDDLPIGLLAYQTSVVLARKGVTAFADDFKGGADSGRGYGTYSRDAHEWDISG